MSGTAVMRQETQGLAPAADHGHAGVVSNAPTARAKSGPSKGCEGRLGRRHVAPRRRSASAKAARVKGLDVQHRHVS
jgi:hypothetical protein